MMRHLIHDSMKTFWTLISDHHLVMKNQAFVVVMELSNQPLIWLLIMKMSNCIILLLISRDNPSLILSVCPHCYIKYYLHMFPPPMMKYQYPNHKYHPNQTLKNPLNLAMTVMIVSIVFLLVMMMFITNPLNLAKMQMRLNYFDPMMMMLMSCYLVILVMTMNLVHVLMKMVIE